GLLVSAATFGANGGGHPGHGALALIWLGAATLAGRRPRPAAAPPGPMPWLSVFRARGHPEGPGYPRPAVAVFPSTMARPLRAGLALLGGLLVASPLFYEVVLDDPNSLAVNTAVTFIYLAVPAVGGVIAREARDARAQAAAARRERHCADERVA